MGGEWEGELFCNTNNGTRLNSIACIFNSITIQIMPGWKRPSDVFVHLSFRCQSNQSQAPSQESQQRERESESRDRSRSRPHTRINFAQRQTQTHTPPFVLITFGARVHQLTNALTNPRVSHSTTCVRLVGHFPVRMDGGSHNFPDELANSHSPRHYHGHSARLGGKKQWWFPSDRKLCRSVRVRPPAQTERFFCGRC